MSFSTQQIKKLSARIRSQHIREREVEGRTLHYIEGWHAISEANRIFGFDAWDRETISSQCVWQKPAEGRYGAAYVAKIRLTVRAGASTIVREGFGAGEATAPTPGQAHERAAKAAETDATKRALSTFGNSFGLSLYRSKQASAVVQSGQRGRPKTIRAVARAVEPSPSRRSSRLAAQAEPRETDDGARPSPSDTAPVTQPRLLQDRDIQEARDDPSRPAERVPIDKSLLPFGEPKRHRAPEHLRFVARQPCLICGRGPTQAHHLRYTQPRAVGRKVSDEFVVPLCPFHHDEVHRTGNEYNWWRARGIDAVAVAYQLWDAFRHGADSDEDDGRSESVPRPADDPATARRLPAGTPRTPTSGGNAADRDAPVLSGPIAANDSAIAPTGADGEP